MVDLHICGDIENIEKEWKETLRKNPLLTPFQSYEWNMLLQKKYRDSFSRRISFRVCFMLACFNNEYMIAPLSVNHLKKEVYFLGQNEISDYLDFIYSQDLQPVFFTEFIQALRQKFSGYSIFFDRIRDLSRTNHLLRQVPGCMKIADKPCCGIPIANTRETYFSSLSKNTRGVVRQSLNRLIRDGKLFETEIIHGYLPKDTANEMLEVYRTRREDVHKKTLMQRVLLQSKEMFKKESMDIFTEMLTLFPDSFSAIARIDREIAAFCAGFSDKKKNLYLCRVSMNPKFARYRPGVVLICKTMELLSDEPDSELKWRYFDLTRGKESYKMQLGGELHYNSLYQIGGE